MIYDNPLPADVMSQIRWLKESGVPVDDARERAINFCKLGSLHKEPDFENRLNGAIEIQYGQKTIFDPKSPLPESLYPSQGLIAESVKLMSKYAPRSQPVYALPGAISLMSVITGRKVRTERDSRTNIILVAVGSSGSGKDYPRQFARKVLHKCEAIYLLAPESVFSGSGIITTMANYPAKLFLWDEFGRLLEVINGQKAGSLERGVITKVLTLYSSSNSIFQPDAYANEESNVWLDQPHQVVYGSTVPDSLWGGIGHESMSNGLMSRMLIFESNTLPDMQYPGILELPGDYANSVREWTQFQPEPAENILERDSIVPKIIPFSADARKLLIDQTRKFDEKARMLSEREGASLWVRAAEKAEKLALIHSCSLNRPSEDFLISEEDMSWVMDLTEWLTRRFLIVAGERLAENKTESLHQRVLKIIKDNPKISRRDLTRKTQWLSRRDRNEILVNLCEAQQLSVQLLPPGENGKQAEVISAICL